VPARDLAGEREPVVPVELGELQQHALASDRAPTPTGSSC